MVFQSVITISLGNPFSSYEYSIISIRPLINDSFQSQLTPNSSNAKDNSVLKTSDLLIVKLLNHFLNTGIISAETLTGVLADSLCIKASTSIDRSLQ